MKFVLWVCVDESLPVSAEEADVRPWLAEAHRRGFRLEGHQLRQVSDATTVRARGELVTDGPFAETKEQIAGYDLIECADLAEAVEIAALHPVARFGSIEIRPVWEP
jgi:hypothetical protein